MLAIEDWTFSRRGLRRTIGISQLSIKSKRIALFAMIACNVSDAFLNAGKREALETFRGSHCSFCFRERHKRRYALVRWLMKTT